MSSNQVKLLSICMQSGLPTSGMPNPETVPVMLVGPPGTSKTEIVKHVSKSIEKAINTPFHFASLALPQIAPEVIGGVPVPNQDKKFCDLFPLAAGKLLTEAGAGCFLLDEYSSAPDSVAAACLTLVQSGMLGDHRLPSSVARVVAMNEPEKATAGRDLAAPESNRFCWMSWELNLDDWLDYMKGGTGAASSVVILPKDWELNYYHEANTLVATFLRQDTSHFLVEPDPSDAGHAWPSPRSWRNAVRLGAAVLSIGQKPSSTLFTDAVWGCVGESTGRVFTDWINNMNLPDPEEVLAAGPDYDLPSRDDKAIVILNSLAHLVNREHENRIERWRRACEIVDAKAKQKSDICLDVVSVLMNKYPPGLKSNELPALCATYYKQKKTLELSTGQVGNRIQNKS